MRVRNLSCYVFLDEMPAVNYPILYIWNRPQTRNWFAPHRGRIVSKVSRGMATGEGAGSGEILNLKTAQDVSSKKNALPYGMVTFTRFQSSAVVFSRARIVSLE